MSVSVLVNSALLVLLMANSANAAYYSFIDRREVTVTLEKQSDGTYVSNGATIKEEMSFFRQQSIDTPDEYSYVEGNNFGKGVTRFDSTIKHKMDIGKLDETSDGEYVILGANFEVSEKFSAVDFVKEALAKYPKEVSDDHARLADLYQYYMLDDKTKRVIDGGWVNPDISLHNVFDADETSFTNYTSSRNGSVYPKKVVGRSKKSKKVKELQNEMIRDVQYERYESIFEYSKLRIVYQVFNTTGAFPSAVYYGNNVKKTYRFDLPKPMKCSISKNRKKMDCSYTYQHGYTVAMPTREEGRKAQLPYFLTNFIKKLETAQNQKK